MLPAAQSEFSMSDQDFERMRTLVYKLTGISMGIEKRNLLYSRLARRLRTLGLKTFKQYCDLVESSGSAEVQHFTNAVTTNLTSFFREQHHFDYLIEDFIPSYVARKGSGRGLRIWSAGCSSGEEPYTIAMALHESLRPSDLADVKVLASDIDTEMLQTASAGVYQIDRIDSLSQERKKRFFLRGTGEKKDLVKVRPELMALIQYKQINLTESFNPGGQFDIIFCRNVAIYFDKPTQQRVYSRLGECLTPGGALIIGHSESLYTLADKFDVVGKTIYRPKTKRLG
ncbi:MAG: protein-glutamate O-methyltransferase [Gammaproteobacteria bacterium]|nr:protein-glutamate O-methyltransferase [Gammaproteobacteria bacterium]